MPKNAEPIQRRLERAAATALRADGRDGLQARKIASAAGCAVGSIYKSFVSLEALADAVIAETFLRLGEDLRRAKASASPVEAPAALALAYLRFARREGRLWLAAFELPTTSGTAEGERRRTAFEALLAEGQSALQPIVPAARLEAATRTIWAGLHGLTHLAASGAFGDVADAALEALATDLVHAVLEAERGSGR